MADKDIPVHGVGSASIVYSAGAMEYSLLEKNGELAVARWQVAAGICNSVHSVNFLAALRTRELICQGSFFYVIPA
jgi:hypothetical protein